MSERERDRPAPSGFTDALIEKRTWPSWEAYVAAHRAALGGITRQIAERIAGLAAP